MSERSQRKERLADAPVTLQERRALEGEAFWATIGTLYRWRRFIAGTTAVVAVLAVVTSLILPNWYRAQTRLLLPTRSGSGLLAAALMDNLPTTARTVLGAPGSDYFRYLTVLTSRTMYKSVVDAFDLVSVYEVEDSRAPLDAAIELLAGNAAFLVDERYEFLTVSVLDKDAERAADMANFFVSELGRMNADLASRSAGRFRGFVEHRYGETLADLDSVQTKIRVFQETHGVLDLATQGEQFFSYLAELRLQGLQAEVEYEALLGQFGTDNSMVQSARATVRAADRKFQDALAGQESLLPIPAEALPEIQSRYLELERERLILATLLEYVRPVLEEARFDEERQIEAVQVVDQAVPPARKAKPTRSVICIVATLSAFMLASLFALAQSWWTRNHADLAHRLHAAVDASASARGVHGGSGPAGPP